MIQKTASRVVVTWLIAAILTIPQWSHAVTILSGPSFTPATNAPLAGLLQLTTDVDSRISVLVSDGTGIWERDFYDYATTHSVPLLGFKPDQTNQILVTVYDKDRNAYTAPQLLTFVTAPLPANFPTYHRLEQVNRAKWSRDICCSWLRTEPVPPQVTLPSWTIPAKWFGISPAILSVDDDVRQLGQRRFVH